MRGNIFRDLILPQISYRRTNDAKKRGLVTLSMMRRNIERIASETRDDYPSKETRVGDVIRRRRVSA